MRSSWKNRWNDFFNEWNSFLDEWKDFLKTQWNNLLDGWYYLPSALRIFYAFIIVNGILVFLVAIPILFV